MERLSDVIIRSGAQDLNLILPAFAGGQHQHRHRHVVAAPATNQRKAVFIRQAKIDDGDVRNVLTQIVIRFLCVFRRIDLMSQLLQLNFQVVAQQSVILNHEYAHASSPFYL
jgi:hypothetical protein